MGVKRVAPRPIFSSDDEYDDLTETFRYIELAKSPAGPVACVSSSSDPEPEVEIETVSDEDAGNVKRVYEGDAGLDMSSADEG